MKQPISRRSFLGQAAAGAAACGGAVEWAMQSAWAADRPPNILMVFTDDHAPQAISAYGSRINETPHIDRIAREGAIFLNNTCGNSICAPSRASVLTGKHSHANGQRTNRDVFDGSQDTFPKRLQAAGYETALIGKWHLRSDPTGFNHWEILPGQGSYYNPDFLYDGGERRYGGYVTDIVTDLSIEWLRTQRSADRPFLLMAQHKAPHRTWAPGPDHLDLYRDVEIPEPPTLFDDFSGRAAVLAENEMMIAEHLMYEYDLKLRNLGIPDALGRDFECRETARMTPEQLAAWDAAYGPENEAFKANPPEGDDLVRWKYQRYIKDYLRCVASVDDNVGRILTYLDEAGLAGNTMVVYSSDQGFYLGEHGLYDKRWMYRESFGMPLVMRWPGVIPADTRVDALTQNIDFAPTFLDVAGIDTPDAMHGRSLLPLARGAAPDDWRDAVYYHYYEVGEHNVPRHEGVATKCYKLIHYYDVDQWELFDLEQDPMELQSVYSDPAYTDTLARLTATLTQLRAQYAVPEPEPLA